MPHAIKPAAAALGVNILIKMRFEAIKAISAKKQFRYKN
jgi:hypothetical protein